ncbi:hypothetical protein D3C79_1017370 [compost metagenome]
MLNYGIEEIGFMVQEIQGEINSLRLLLQYHPILAQLISAGFDFMQCLANIKLPSPGDPPSAGGELRPPNQPLHS